MNAFAAWMALGLVALSRCLSLVCPELSKAVSMKKRNLMVVVCVWVYAIILVLPTSLKMYGKFGYDPHLGKCDFIVTEPDKIHPRVMFLSIGFIIPMIMIIVSYSTIWRTTVKSSSFLKLNS